MITIIDYGVGNLFSLSSSFSYIGADVMISGNPAETFEQLDFVVSVVSLQIS